MNEYKNINIIYDGESTMFDDTIKTWSVECKHGDYRIIETILGGNTDAPAGSVTECVALTTGTKNIIDLLADHFTYTNYEDETETSEDGESVVVATYTDESATDEILNIMFEFLNNYPV
jgi:hypothetical protein